MAGMDDFEVALREEIPRGLERMAKVIGRERGLSASWLLPEEMSGANWQTKGGVLLGERQGSFTGWRDDRHLCTVAGSRAGKGVSLIIPNLLVYEGSAVVIDPKGENAARTAGRRGTGSRGGGAGLGQDVHVLDPFSESGLPCSSFNVLAAIDPTSPEAVDEIGLFADALIVHPDKADRHWTESAQSLLRSLILMVVTDSRFADRRNLVTVRKLLILADPAIKKLQQSQPDDADELTAEQALVRLLLDQESSLYGYICTGMGEQLLAMGDKERGSVLSTARTQTHWLDSPMMKKVLERNDFELGDLKRKRMTIYLCLPSSRMAAHARWLRLMILLALSSMERTKVDVDVPVLFVLDEFNVLGHLESVELAAGLMAGFGVKLWPIVQNVAQLKRHYPDSWETFFANAGIITAFGISDTETLKVLSELLGRTGIVAKVDSGVSRGALNQGASPLHDDRREVPLLAEHELRMIFARGKDRALVFNAEDRPAVVRRIKYYNDPRFRGLYDPDPRYGVQ